MNTKPRIGITMGDPAGIGPELCVRTLASPEMTSLCRPVIFGSLDVLQRVSRDIRVALPDGLREWDGSAAAGEAEVVVANCPGPAAASIVPGKVSAACGQAGYRYIETAIKSAVAGQIAAVVTAPIHKEALRLSGVQHPGHTEIFTALTGAKRTCMMLRSEVLTVSMVTTHIGYADVPGRLTIERVLDVIELTASAVQVMNQRPARLAICGLNPHAGEHGLFGQQEEERRVEPAVRLAREKGIAIEGPLPPDTAFTTASRKRFDAVVCLYHDQGHIPFKMLAFEDGVNITLGLPIVRTSVDHGTAFDIAWKGVASPVSLFKAIEAGVLLSASTFTSLRAP